MNGGNMNGNGGFDSRNNMGGDPYAQNGPRYSNLPPGAGNMNRPPNALDQQYAGPTNANLPYGQQSGPYGYQNQNQQGPYGPPRKRSNLGLILGLSIGGAIAAFIILIVVGIFAAGNIVQSVLYSDWPYSSGIYDYEEPYDYYDEYYDGYDYDDYDYGYYEYYDLYEYEEGELTPSALERIRKQINPAHGRYEIISIETEAYGDSLYFYCTVSSGERYGWDEFAGIIDKDAYGDVYYDVVYTVMDDIEAKTGITYPSVVFEFVDEYEYYITSAYF